MDKENIEKINEVMKRFDPLLVAVAIGEIGVKSELIQKEVANIKEALKKFDKSEVMAAGADYVGLSSVAFSCGGAVVENTRSGPMPVDLCVSWDYL